MVVDDGNGIKSDQELMETKQLPGETLSNGWNVDDVMICWLDGSRGLGQYVEAMTTTAILSQMYNCSGAERCFIIGIENGMFIGCKSI